MIIRFFLLLEPGLERLPLVKHAAMLEHLHVMPPQGLAVVGKALLAHVAPLQHEVEVRAHVVDNRTDKLRCSDSDSCSDSEDRWHHVGGLFRVTWLYLDVSAHAHLLFGGILHLFHVLPLAVR